MNETPEQPQTLPYANFLVRLMAYFVDNLVISLFNAYLLFPVLVMYGIKTAVIPPFDEIVDMLKENPGISVFEIFGITSTDFIVFMFATILTEWLYFAGMESSPKQGTLGKILLRIKVTDMQGESISFRKASARYFGKIISRLTFFVGFIMAAFTEKKQALHDMMAGCLVLRKQV